MALEDPHWGWGCSEEAPTHVCGEVISVVVPPTLLAQSLSFFHPSVMAVFTTDSRLAMPLNQASQLNQIGEKPPGGSAERGEDLSRGITATFPHHVS